MRQVTQQEFYATIGPQNCHPHILPGRYPYTSEFRTPSGRVIGKAVGQLDGSDQYFLPETEAEQKP